MLKNNKGITLIALVITIIVLLILAGVSIAMLTGDNGILTQATKAGSETKISEDKEQALLKINELTSEYYEKKYATTAGTTATSVGAYVATELVKITDDPNVTYSGDATSVTITTKSTDKDGKAAQATYTAASTTLSAWAMVELPN